MPELQAAGDRNVALLTSLAVLLIMPFVGFAALVSYELLDGWHLLVLFPVEMMAAQFGWVGDISFVAIGSLRTAATDFVIVGSRHRWLVTLLVLGIHVLMAVFMRDRIHGNGH